MAEQEFTTEELKSEEWRDVAGYEESYSVSNLGRVRRDKQSKGARAGKILKTYKTKRGYYYVSLSRARKDEKHHFVHRLVAAAFIGPCPKGKEVNHKQSSITDKGNNRISNLEYLTPMENTQDAKRRGLTPSGDRHYLRRHPEKVLRGDKHRSTRLSDRDVEIIKHSQEPGIALSKRFKISPTHVSNIRHGKARKGFIEPCPNS